jgi:transposase
MHRAEVITVERRRRWSWADKQQIVDETLMPGASISAVARRYGLHPSQVFAWRKTVREGDIADATGCGSFDCAFAPVVVTKPRLRICREKTWSIRRRAPARAAAGRSERSART